MTAFPPRLKPLQWCAIEGAVYFAVQPSRLPPDYKLSYAELPTGITLYQVDQVVIRNLTIRGFQADGVAAAVGARNVVLDNVTCTANGQSGVCVQGGAQVEIDSCKLAGNGQIATVDPGRVRDPPVGQQAGQRHGPRLGRSRRTGLPGVEAD